MKKMISGVVALALAGMTSVAMADAKAPAKPAKPEAAKPDAAKPEAKPAEMAAPKAPAENDMLKKWVGTMSCDGTTKGPDGKDMKYKTTWTVKAGLSGMWYSLVYKRAKGNGMPAFEGNATVGYSSADKKYMFVGFDSMGGWINLSSTDGMSYAGDGVPMGKKAPVKIAFAKGKDKKGAESDKMVDVSLDLGGMMLSESCKK